MFTDTQAKAGITALKDAALKCFLHKGFQREVEQQRAVFAGERNITNVLTPAQEKARDDGETFEPDFDRAKNHATTSLEFGITRRLEGAYACYKAGMELECLRHILIALDVVCCTIGWHKASAYINEQNGVLLEMKRRDEVA